MSLLPVKQETLFYYECPKCKSEHLVREAEVSQIGKKLCYCGYVMLLSTQCHTQTLDVVAKQSAKKTTRFDDIIIVLCNLGLKKYKAKQIILDKIAAGGDINNEGRFVEEIIKEYL